jgi:hypothetical protein
MIRIERLFRRERISDFWTISQQSACVYVAVGTAVASA